MASIITEQYGVLKSVESRSTEHGVRFQIRFGHGDEDIILHLSVAEARHLWNELGTSLRQYDEGEAPTS